MIALLYQGNQVAIKKIKNHLTCNFQKPSIVAEFNMVTMEFLNFCYMNSDQNDETKAVKQLKDKSGALHLNWCGLA